MASILVVCTGNICRSPLIERLLQRSLDAAYGPGVVPVRSAGTLGLVDSPMDASSAAILGDLGGTADDFRARRLAPAMVRDVDLVVTATREHRAEVVRAHPRALRRTFTLRELALLADRVDPAALPVDPDERLAAVAQEGYVRRGESALLDPQELDVVDPYRRSEETYALMKSQVTAAMERVVPLLAPGGGPR